MLANRAKHKTTGASAKASFALVLALCGACSIGLTAPPGVEIKRSGVLAPGGPTVEIVYWTDDTHVLFIGAKPGVFETLPDGRKPLKNFLTQWDTANGETKTLAELGEYAGLCYDSGYSLYWYRKPGDQSGRPGEPVFAAGPLGHEVLITRKGSINRFTCRDYDERRVNTEIGKGFWPLREEHGYWGGYQGRTGTFLVREEAGGKIEIPLNIPYEPYIRWSGYSGAYVFRRLESLTSRTQTMGKMWLLSPDGQTKEFIIPAGPWFGGATGYDITSRGIFIWSYALGHLAIGDAGGYLMQEGLPKRFIEGLIYAYGISQDGCKIALSVGQYGRPRDSAEMLMANICKKSG
jgi:hypothetical protein